MPPLSHSPPRVAPSSIISAASASKAEAARFQAVLAVLLQILSSHVLSTEVTRAVNDFVHMMACSTYEAGSRDTRGRVQTKASASPRSCLFLKHQTATLQFMQLNLLGTLESIAAEGSKSSSLNSHSPNLTIVLAFSSMLTILTRILSCGIFCKSSGIKRNLLLLGRRSATAPVAFVGSNGARGSSSFSQSSSSLASSSSEATKRKHDSVPLQTSGTGEVPSKDCLMRRWITFIDQLSAIYTSFDSICVKATEARVSVAVS